MTRARNVGAVGLWAGVAVPVLYFGSVLAAAPFYPGFSFVRQFASELGAEGAPHPYILNTGLVGVGLAGILAGRSFWRTLLELGARPIAARWTGLLIAMFGVAIVMAGLFPHPSLLHWGFGLSIPFVVAPTVLAFGLRHRPEATPLRRYLLATNAMMIVLFIATLAAAHSPIVGLCQLLYTLAAIPWLGVGAVALMRYRRMWLRII